MTDLKKQVKRKTMGTYHGGRRLVVLLMPGDILGIREERRRRVFVAPLGRIYAAVVRWNVEAERAERKKNRKKGRKT